MRTSGFAMSLFGAFFARLRAALGEPVEHRLRRRLRAAAPAPLAELREGMHCRISGIVSPFDTTTLEAPLSGVRCVAYMLEIVESSVQGQLLIAFDKRAVPFLLTDAAHHAVIDPTYSELVGTRVLERKWFARSTPDQRQQALLDRYCDGHVSRAVTFGLQFRELIVEIGQRVSIAGTGQREVDPLAAGERGFRDHRPQRLRLAGTQDLPLLIGDADG